MVSIHVTSTITRNLMLNLVGRLRVMKCILSLTIKKGNPEIVKRERRRNRLRGAKGRGTLEKEKTPVLGLIQRGGEVVIKVLYNVKQVP
jgi:hypothetical protein